MRLNYLPDFIAGGKAYFSSVVSIALVILLLSLSSLAAAPGDLDPAFGGGDGKVILPVTSGVTPGHIGGVIIQPADGKILAGGSVRFGNPPGHVYRVAMMRLTPDGSSFDPSFGTNGVIIPNAFSSNSACNFNLQADGKIILACRFFSGTVQGVILQRFNSNGTADMSFGNPGDGGVVVTNLNASFDPSDINFQPDGKIIVGGDASFDGDYSRFVLVRYNANGTPDNSFGTGGVAVAPPNTNRHDLLVSVVIQPSGRIVASGSTSANSFLLTGFNPNGTIDQAFGTDGVVLTPAGSSYPGGQARLAAGGKIVVLGGSPAMFMRHNSDGSLDTTFGSNGVAVFQPPPNGRISTFELQPNGKIVAGGYFSAVNPTSLVFLAARFNPNGSPDKSFGTNGFVVTGNFGIPGAGHASDVAISPADGKILVVGTNTYDKYTNNPVLVRLLANGQREYDFDGDRKSDVSIFRPSNSAEWYWLNSGVNNQSSSLQFGIGLDKPVPTDFDGDGQADICVFRANGDWYRINSSNNEFIAVHFGQNGDQPVPADFDGDGKADLAVYREGDWYILNSSDNSFRAEHFGISSDKPIVPADFDGDGKNDLTVYRATEGVWYAQRSRDGFFGAQFGVASDKPVAADYDGDGRTDLAVFRPSDGVWYLQRSHLGFTATQFGIATDRAVPADYDGDGNTDLGVYRDGNWYLLRSQQGFTAIQFGVASDTPVPNTFVP